MNMGSLLASAAGTSAISTDMKAVLQGGFADMTATVTDVVGISVAACVGIICLTAGVNYALKKIRGVLNKAS